MKLIARKREGDSMDAAVFQYEFEKLKCPTWYGCPKKRYVIGIYLSLGIIHLRLQFSLGRTWHKHTE